MNEKRFQKTRIVDKWGGIYDSETDEILNVNDVEHKLNEQQATISALKEENEQLRQIMNDIVVATDETYTKNASVFKVTVVLDFEKYMEIRRCIE